MADSNDKQPELDRGDSSLLRKRNLIVSAKNKIERGYLITMSVFIVLLKKKNFSF